MRRFSHTIAAALAALLLSSPPSWAWLAQSPYPCPNALGDLYSLTHYWGIRAYKASYALSGGQSMTVIRASDSVTCNFVYDGSGQLFNLITASCSDSGTSDGQSPATFCNATTCKPTKIVNQAGGTACSGGTACDYAQATDANRFTLDFSCGKNPFCVKLESGQSMAAPNYTPPSATETMILVAQRISGSTFVDLMRGPGSNNIIRGQQSVSAWQSVISNSISGGNNTAGTQGAFHAAVLTIDGANSAFDVDSTQTTSNRTGNTTASTLSITGSLSPAYWLEAASIASTGLDLTNRTAVISNLRACHQIP